MTLREIVERYNFLTDTIKQIDDIYKRITVEVKNASRSSMWDGPLGNEKRAILIETGFAMDIQGLLGMLKDRLVNELETQVTVDKEAEKEKEIDMD